MKNTLILLGLAVVIAFGGCKKPEKEPSTTDKLTCSITSPKEGAELSIEEDLVVTVEATDPKGTIAMVTVSLDNIPFPCTLTAPYTATIPYSLLTLGKHTIKALAVNTEGAKAEKSITVTIIESTGNETESPNFVTFANGKIPISWKTSTWTIDVATGYDDNYSLSAKSYSASVVTSKTMNVLGYIEFYTKGSSFDLYIDRIKKQAFSSTTVGDWKKWIYIFEQGKHEFRWEMTYGATVYLDAIRFAAATLPEVTTNAVTNITPTSATVGGNVTNSGNSTVLERGVCWSTTEKPTINDNKIPNGTGTGSFTGNLTELPPNTLCYVRAYATNSVGTAYGEQKSFTTQSFQLPIVTTNNITDITSSTAQCGGTVTSNNPVTARGVCWSTTQNPTINDYKTNDGYTTGSFTSNITGLTKSTIYYVRAYATNAVGTNYGNQVSFTTDDGLSIIINGVKWATCNVNRPGSFTAKPEDAGMFYQWNRRIGWSSTNPMINSDGSTTWNSSNPTGYSWTKENDPCPTGWRVPTNLEITSLHNSGSQWTTLNGIQGRIFGSGNNTLFLPAAGYRFSNGELFTVGDCGYYWSNEIYSSYEPSAYELYFANQNVTIYHASCICGFSVRCVAE